MTVTSKARIFAAAVLALAVVALAPPARAQQVVADLSRHLVGITTGFVGTDVLLFGATEGEGDVIVIVRGPDRRETVRRKGRVGGIWVNTDEVAFASAPAFYAVAASGPVNEIVSPRVLWRHRIGTENLELRPVRPLDASDLAAFRAGLLRNKIRQGLYYDKPGRVTFLGNRLFRANLYFPANVPTGTYTVEVLLARQGQIVSAQTTPLLISKIGIGADVYRFAHENSAFYGIFAIVMALAAGWIAGVVFRKA
ncbi:MAG: TIGR02186 family protein [Alphaproteobacteria bacterium]